jgi:putative membrane protein
MALRELLAPYQDQLPTVNASLNAVATVFLVSGWIFIRSKRVKPHLVCMLSAVVISTLFLTSYVAYHWLKAGMVTRFTAGGWAEPVYKFILLTHVILAALTPVLVIVTLVPALRARFDKHRRVARWTLPIWLYVSVTGVLVYLMLYIWFPPQAVSSVGGGARKCAAEPALPGAARDDRRGMRSS